MIKKLRLLALLLAVALILPACGKAEEERPELLEPVNAKLEAALVERRDLSDMTLYSAQLLPETLELTFGEDGYLYGVYVNAGDRVGEGEVIASLVGKNYTKIQDLEDEIADSKKRYDEEFEAIEIELELAKLAGDDTAELELELKHSRESAELTLQEKQNRLDSMKENDIGYIYITAPFDCTVMAVTSTRNGGYIAGDTPVAVIDIQGDLTLTCDFINEVNMRYAYDCYAIIRGERYELEYQAYTKDELRIMSANSVTPVSRFKVLGDTSDVEAGDYAVVVFVKDMSENVLVVPVSAVYSDSTGKFVYEIVDNVRVKRTVVTGISDSTYVEIVDGIEEGASVYVKE